MHLFPFVFVLAALVLSQPPPRRIALTFDDLPASQGAEDAAHAARLNASVVAALQKHRASAVGFVNEGKLGADAGRAARIDALRIWTRAGYPLGNHTRSHPDLNTTPLEIYQEDVIAGEPVTLELMREAQLTGRWFRHPYTHTGPTKDVKAGLSAFLKDRGYTVAPFTVEHVDYLFSNRYRRAKQGKAGGDGGTELARRIGDAYLAHLDSMLEFFEGLSRETFGREIAQILLVHVNDINAEYLPAMLEKMRARGYDFVTLDEAMSDPAYRTADDYVGMAGPSWLHRWRVTKGLPSKLREEPDPPDWIMSGRP
jgi:peptidoglycan-N-acetylglucosamine deacetylase